MRVASLVGGGTLWRGLLCLAASLPLADRSSGSWAAEPLAGFLAVDRVEPQPLAAATARLIEGLEVVGAPLGAAAKAALQAARSEPDAARATAAIQAVLDPLCVAGVLINAESRVSVVEGPAAKQLIQQGWTTFLVKVHNLAGITPAPTTHPSMPSQSDAPTPPPIIPASNSLARPGNCGVSTMPRPAGCLLIPTKLSVAGQCGWPATMAP